MAASSLVRRFPPELAVLPEARRAVRTWLEQSSVGPGALHDELVLAGTELCTEAIEEGGPGPVVLRAWVDEESVVLEVERPRPAAQTLRSVRSLWQDEAKDVREGILRAVCDDLSRSTEGRVLLATCRRRVS